MSRILSLLLLLGAVLAPASPARAAESTPGTLPSVRVLSYNVCAVNEPCSYMTGRTGQEAQARAAFASAVSAAVDAWDADVLMLQELCSPQYDLLTATLSARGYVGAFHGTLNLLRCDAWGGGSGNRAFGNGVFVRSASLQKYAYDLTVPAGEQPRNLLCARAAIDGRSTLACNTHLARYQNPDGNGDSGAGEAMRHVNSLAGTGPVILGGDFNERTPSATMRTVRNGKFVAPEADCTTGGSCPFTELDATVDTFDHILVSTGHFQTGTADEVTEVVTDPTGTAFSDHPLLIGGVQPGHARATPTVPGDMTGDGRTDLLAVQNSETGNLRLYAGLGDGRLATARQIGTGGWDPAVIGHRGDWTGDGWEDLVAKIGDNLWVYPNNGTGGLGTRIPMKNRATGWAAVEHLAFPGDVTGDKIPDLLVQSAKTKQWWLWRGDPVRRPGLQPSPTEFGGADFADADLLPVGDVNQDGRDDLWARNRATGALALWHSNGQNNVVKAGAVTGGSWPAAGYPLVAALSDRAPGLWAAAVPANATSSLLFHAGIAEATGAQRGRAVSGTPAVIGSGGWEWILALA
ncbi:FG-GAP-like repeat-containing protein [Actinoplanes sp. NPDC024001]|uniref:FG-GAP-like repeat-containing protein n=1 Tax=Actinoplanes sp. NPDC024001 TaxID=3154598 RepID=UPI003404762E